MKQSDDIIKKKKKQIISYFLVELISGFFDKTKVYLLEFK